MTISRYNALHLTSDEEEEEEEVKSSEKEEEQCEVTKPEC